MHTNVSAEFDTKSYFWPKRSAVPTLTVRRILSYEGVLLRHHLDGGVAKGALTQEQADAKFNAWKAEQGAKVEAKKTGLKNAAIEAKKAACEFESLA